MDPGILYGIGYLKIKLCWVSMKKLLVIILLANSAIFASDEQILSTNMLVQSDSTYTVVDGFGELQEGQNSAEAYSPDASSQLVTTFYSTVASTSETFLFSLTN
jgi:hypothetical protein